MRYVFAALIAVCSCLLGKSQPYDYTELKEKIPESHQEEDFVLLHNNLNYSFHRNSSGDLSARMDADLVMVTSKSTFTTYFDFTNSYSMIRSVDGEVWLKNASRPTRLVWNHEVTQYESGGIFHNDFFVNSMSPDYRSNGVYTLKYRKLYEDYKFLSVIHLLNQYQPLNTKVTLEIPDDLEIDIVEMNFENFEITRSEEILKDGKLITYTMEDIPYLGDCHYCPSFRHYAPHLVLVYKSMGNDDKRKELLPEVGNLYRWYRQLVEEVEDNPEEIKELTDKFRSIEDPDDQIQAVYDWIKNNIRYIAFESGIAGFKPDACQTVYHNRYGDCKGMANLCKNVLIQLGHDARLAWIGTRKEVPYDYSIPSLAVDNHMITAVKTDEGFVFVDPTETYGSYKEYAYRIQGRPVLIEDGDEFILSTVPESEVHGDVIYRSYEYEFNPAEVTATFTGMETYKGEPKKMLLANYNLTLANQRDKALIRFLRPYETGSFDLRELKGVAEESDSIHFAYSFTTPSGIIDVGGQYYLDLDPTADLEYFKLEDDRIPDYYFDERYNRRTRVKMKLPEGFSVAHKPEPFSHQTDEFEITVRLDELKDGLLLDKKIHIYSGEISSESRPEFESALRNLKKYYEDRIILNAE